MHEQTKKRLWHLLFDVRDIKFPLIMGATSSNPMVACARFTPAACTPPDLKGYFKAINRFVVQLNSGFVKPSEMYESLRSACRSLQGEFVVENTPSIRMPGKNSFFRAVSTSDSVKVLTFESQKDWIAEHKNAVFSIPRDKSGMLLYYPAIITVPVKIPLLATDTSTSAKESFPRMLSMAQGTFLHAFKNIDASELNLIDFLSVLLGLVSPSVRAFVIDNLTCIAPVAPHADGTDLWDDPEVSNVTAGEKIVLRGVVVKTEGRTIKSPSGADTHIVRLTVVCKNQTTGGYQEAVAPEQFSKIDDGHWYVVATNTAVGRSYPVGRLNQFVWKDIDAKRYQEIARQVIESSLPDKETLFQASGGKETITQVKKAAIDIVMQTIKGV